MHDGCDPLMSGVGDEVDGYVDVGGVVGESGGDEVGAVGTVIGGEGGGKVVGEDVDVDGVADQDGLVGGDEGQT